MYKFKCEQCKKVLISRTEEETVYKVSIRKYKSGEDKEMIKCSKCGQEYHVPIAEICAA